MASNLDEFNNLSMLDLFRLEAENHSRVLDSGLQGLENDQSPDRIEALARAAHSIKGAARIVGLNTAVDLANAMEEVLSKAQKGSLAVNSDQIEALSQGTHIFSHIAGLDASNIQEWLQEKADDVSRIIELLQSSPSGKTVPAAVKEQKKKKAEISDPKTGKLPQDLGDLSMLDLFRLEAENHARILESGLVDLEKDQSPERVEPLMRAAHSIKGAARIVGLDIAVALAHAMEDVLSAAQKAKLPLNSDDIDILLCGNDIFTHVAGLRVAEVGGWLAEQNPAIKKICQDLQQILSGGSEGLAGSGSKPAEHVAEPKAKGAPQDLGDLSMLDLFRLEAENHARILESGLVDLEKDQSPERVEPLMRAAHSIKGAARIVGLDIAVALAHAMEDVLSAAQRGELKLTPDHIDILLSGNDIFARAASMDVSNLALWLKEESESIEKISSRLGAMRSGQQPKPESAPVSKAKVALESEASAKPGVEREGADTIVRITAENLSRLMGLAGESLIEARSLESFARTLLDLKNQHYEVTESLERVRQLLPAESLQDPSLLALNLATDAVRRARSTLTDHLESFDLFTRRLEHLADRLYNEVIASRMRPFSDGTYGFSRMLRDLAKKLKKRVNFQILGESTKVDRDILEKLEAPLTHLLRNAVDHGLEVPEERVAEGKPEEGDLTLEARHRAGMLSITVTDDGRGIDPESIKRKVIEKGLGSKEMAASLTRSELMDFLFLPGFTTAGSVTEISGRGVGLDVVHSMVQEVGGSVRCDSMPGQGTRFHMQLPLSLSVVRTILVDISNEPYAIPLTRIDRILSIERAGVRTVEDRQFCTYDGDNIGLVDAHQILRTTAGFGIGEVLSVVVVSDRMNSFGLVVDHFLGERDLVVKPLDPVLGKVPNISAAAILEDGSPVLILDIDDVVRSIDNMLTQSQLGKVELIDRSAVDRVRKRILVVDDSLTVREVERRLLENKGYEVEIAVDGMDGWNKVRSAHFDLVVSDVDMPRMHGIEFVSKIKSDPKLKDIPVMIVSYKDRDEDKLKGLEAGANYYLTKSSFHDESLINAVIDLIGEP